MEMTNSTTEKQNEKRNNIKTCIVEGWKIFALNTKSYFKYLWLHFLIAGIGFAIFSAETTWFLTKYIQPTQAVIDAGYDASLAKTLFSPSFSGYAALIVAIIAFVIANAIMFGAVFSQIRFYKATDNIPMAGPFAFWKEVKKDAVKTLAIDIIYGFSLSVIVGLITLIAYYTSWWVLTAAIPVIIYWLIIATSGRLQYVTENKPLKVALKDAFSVGHKKFGAYLILVVLTSIPMMMIAYSSVLPASVIQLSASADVISKLAGDPSGLPPYIMPLYVLVATLGYFIFSVAYSLQQWPLALYTSAVSKLKK